MGMDGPRPLREWYFLQLQTRIHLLFHAKGDLLPIRQQNLSGKERGKNLKPVARFFMPLKKPCK